MFVFSGGATEGAGHAYFAAYLTGSFRGTSRFDGGHRTARCSGDSQPLAMAAPPTQRRFAHRNLLHQRVHLILGPIPVLHREGVERQVLDPQLARGSDDHPGGLRPGAVALDPRQVPRDVVTMNSQALLQLDDEEVEVALVPE